jgi:hypothetical protein
MWGRKKLAAEAKVEEPRARPLREALRQARIESAERTGVVVDLRDAELARLELLNETLDPVFADIPADLELFDRGISRGDTPRLWIDAVAHVLMGRDKREYRFVQDTRYGRKVLAESAEIADISDAVTKYVARRMVERERALEVGEWPPAPDPAGTRRHSRWRSFRAFLYGIVIGVAIVVGALYLLMLLS